MTIMKTDKHYGDDDGDNFDYGYMMAIPWQLMMMVMMVIILIMVI